MPNQDFFWFSWSLSSCSMWYAFHFTLGGFLFLLLAAIAQSLQHVMSIIVFTKYLLLSTQHSDICSGTILYTLHHKTGPPPCWGQFPDTLHVYSSWMPQQPFRQVALANLHYNKPTIFLKLIQIELLNLFSFYIGSGYGYNCGFWNLKTYSYATCDVTVTHDESTVSLVERKINPKPNPNCSPNLTWH